MASSTIPAIDFLSSAVGQTMPIALTISDVTFGSETANGAERARNERTKDGRTKHSWEIPIPDVVPVVEYQTSRLVKRDTVQYEQYPSRRVLFVQVP